jgi:hypothetical protein
MTTILPTHDTYLGGEFAATDFSFPHAQVVRGEADMSHCGYFVPLAQAQKAGWSNLETAETIVYNYNGGETAEGLLLTQPRMVLCVMSKLGMFDRTASQDEDRLVVIGEWNREQSKDPNVGNFQIFLVMFLGENNFPLHQVPLKIVAKGAHQATLSTHWEQNCTQVAMLHARAANVPLRPRNERYKALCVFQPVIKRLQVGGGKLKSYACCIDGFVAPTQSNWRSFFLGEGEELLAETILQILNPQPRALQMQPSSESIIALPPAETESITAPPRQISPIVDEAPSQPAVIRQPATVRPTSTVPIEVVTTIDSDEDTGFDEIPF